MSEDAWLFTQDGRVGYPKLEPTSRPLDVPATNRRAWLEQLAREVTYGQAPAH